MNISIRNCCGILVIQFIFFFFFFSTFLYLKFLVVWALVLLADFVLEFRFEYLWPFWLFIRSVYDSFRYQGLVSEFFLNIYDAFIKVETDHRLYRLQ